MALRWKEAQLCTPSRCSWPAAGPGVLRKGNSDFFEQEEFGSLQPDLHLGDGEQDNRHSVPAAVQTRLTKALVEI